MIFFSVVFVSWGSANVEAQKRIKTTYDSYLVATKNVKSFYSSSSCIIINIINCSHQIANSGQASKCKTG